MLNLLHIMVTALKSKSYGIGWHMKSSRPFTMDQAGMISYHALYIATSYSASHSSRRLFKFVFTKDLTEMSWLRFSTAICQIVEFSSSIRRLFKYVFTMDLTDMTRFSFSTAIFHIVEHSNRRLFKYVFIRHLADKTRFSFSIAICHIVEFSSRMLVRHSNKKLFKCVFNRHLAELCLWDCLPV